MATGVRLKIPCVLHFWVLMWKQSAKKRLAYWPAAALSTAHRLLGASSLGEVCPNAQRAPATRHSGRCVHPLLSWLELAGVTARTEAWF